MKSKIDIDNWIRKDHFYFFNQFEEPFHGVTIKLDCTIAYQKAKKLNASFFLYYLYQSLVASQVVEQFRLRIEGNEVFRYDQINAAATISRPDGTFGFGDFVYDQSFDVFYTEAQKVMRRVENETGLQASAAQNRMLFSAIPWIDFTSLSHARMFTHQDSCPRISFGKLTEHEGKKSMPLSIHVNHALVDGRALGEYIDCYQDLMNGRQLKPRTSEDVQGLHTIWLD